MTYALFLAFSAVFIVWCTVDIALGVFGADAAHSAGVDSVEPSCLTGVRALDAAVERALSTRGGRRPASETAGPGAMARFDEALAPEWNEASAIEARCAATPEAARAYSAVSRFRFGAREALVHETELLPLRREVEAYLAP